jgi:DNA-binding response OmpR family regulator
LDASTPKGGPSPGPDRSSKVYLTTLRHDLRAPISAIIGYAELLGEDLTGSDRGEVLADLDRIRSAGRALLALVDDLFDAGKIARGELDLDRVGSRLRHDLRTPLNHVIGYSEMLAEEAEEEGRADLAADLFRIRDSGRHVLRMIEDVLAGAPAGAAAGGEGSTGDDGLSELAVEVLADLEAIGEARAPVEGSEIPGRVLVVDDNELNRDMLSRRVQALGHEVVVASDGAQALEILADGDFDAVLLDIIMPGMNGYRVLSRLKADPTLRSIPVIMITALDEVESAVRCIEMGADDYLPKPFNPTILRARLGALLEKKRLRDREVLYLHRIEEEQRKSDELLHVIFPAEIVRELRATSTVLPRRYDGVAVMFTDIVGFTSYSEDREPEEVIFGLQQLVQAQEKLTERFGMEKIKTIGDSFMAAAGLLRPCEDPVLSCVRCGLEMIRVARDLPPRWELRVGVHAGPLVGGVLGRSQYLFDVIGDTVNTAARVESHAVPGSVTLTEGAWSEISELAQGESLGWVDVKGKGRLELVRFVSFHDAVGE